MILQDNSNFESKVAIIATELVNVFVNPPKKNVSCFLKACYTEQGLFCVIFPPVSLKQYG